MDEDDELQMLQRQFMSAQQQKTNPLAERTVAQIMVKLYHQGFKFYATTDGNQYLTPERLDQQILTLILQRGHLNIGILPQILNVGLDTVEGRVIKILAKHSTDSTNLQTIDLTRNKIYRHNNLLLSQKHLASILLNIKQLLLIEGKVNLQNIALQNQFNMKFTQKLIKQNIGCLNAQLINNQLITKQYNLMKKLKLLGFLRAIRNPISFQSLVKSSKLAQNDDNRTVQRLLNQIIEEKRVKGKYQNSYYVPESFVLNQKQRILEFFTSNGFIQLQMLQKQFLVSKPQEWLQRNLAQTKQFSGNFVILEQVCILTQKIHQLAHNIAQSLQHEGFLEISSVLPFSLEQKELQKFLNDYCKIKDYFLFQGFCYSQKWLQKVLQEFKQKVFKSIFLNSQTKNAKKKGGKKENKSSKLIEEDELVQKLYNQGLAEYSVAQNIAPALLPILSKKLQSQKKRYEKELGQNRGILNSSFLKYRSCNTIMRSIDGLERNLNIIQKQRKKNSQSWTDKDFGQNQTDQKGIYSIIYYDNILPKGWPSLQESLRWQVMPLKADRQLQSGLMTSSSLFGQILAAIQNFNNNFSSGRMLSSPFIQDKQSQKSQSQSPLVFSFYRNQTDRRHIMVDNKLPMVDDKLIGLSGLYGFAQKAYAKFRYCYKGILNLGVKTLLLQLTGQQPSHHTLDKDNHKDILQVVCSALKMQKMVICLAEGQAGKKNQLQFNQGEQKIQINYLKPYLCTQVVQENNEKSFALTYSQPASQLKNNQGQKLKDEYFFKVFKNIYIV